MQNQNSLPPLRADIPEAANILRMSRAELYKRIAAGKLRVQKEGKRTFITTAELQRYVADLGSLPAKAA